MTNWPILSIVTVLPLIGIFFIFFIKGEAVEVSKNTNNVAGLTTISTFIMSLSLIMRFDFHNFAFQLIEQTNLGQIKQGEGYSFGINAVSLVFIVINSFSGMICVFSLRDKIKNYKKEYIIALLLAVSLINGMLCSSNLAMFNVFFFLFPIPFIFIGRINELKEEDDESKWLGLSFLLSSVMLLLAVVLVLGLKDFTNSLRGEKIVWFLMFLALFFRTSLLLNHFWLANFLRKLETPVASFFLIGLMFSCICVVLRFMIPITPNIIVLYSKIVSSWASLTLIYCSFMIIFEKNIFKFLSYLFGIYLGIIFIGIFSLDAFVLSSAVLILVAVSFPFMALQFDFDENLEGDKKAGDVLKFLALPIMIIFPPFAVFSGFVLMISELITKDIFSVSVIVLGMFFSSFSVLMRYKNIIGSKVFDKKNNVIFLLLFLATLVVMIMQADIFSIIFNFSQKNLAENIGVI